MPMAGESPENNRLSPEEAREEANIVRIKLKEILSENLKREPTAEDYGKALAMVEDLKAEALMEGTDKHEKLLRRNQVLEKYGNIGTEAIIRWLFLGLIEKKINMGGAVDATNDAISQLERLRAEAART